MSGLDSTRSLPRPWGAIGAALGSAILFVLAMAIGVVLHVNLPAARRFATRQLNSALETEFKGKLTLEHLTTLHIDDAEGIDVTVSAPDGTTVVVARGLSARIRPVALVRSILRGSGDLDIDVFAIDVQFLDVDLDADEAGALKLATTFELLKPSTTPGSGRVLHLGLSDITVRHALVHGHMKGVPPIDADLDTLRGALRVDGHRVSVDVSHVALLARGMPQGANPRGAVEAHVLVPSKMGRSLGLDASFDGAVGDIPATAKAVFDGNRLDAMFDVPEVSDARVRALVPQAPVYRPVSAHVEAHGDLAKLHATAAVAMAPAELRAAGDLVLEGNFGAAIGIDLRNVDLHALSPPAPHSTLALHADVELGTKGGGMLGGRFIANVAGGEIGGEFVPPATFHGDVEQKAPSRDGAGSNGVEVKIEGTVSEPGAPTQVRADVRTDTPAPRVEFDVSSQVVRLSDIRRWSGLGPGAGQLRVQGAITLGATPSFDAALAGSVEGLARSTARLEKGHLAAHAFGSFTNPEVDATLDADGVQIARYKFHRAHLTTAGRLHAERVTVVLEGDGSPNLRASATIGVFGGPTFENVDAELSRGTHALHASATRVRVDPTGVAVAGASITGVGEPIHASFDTRRGSLVLQGTSKGADLGALGYLLGFEDKLRSGRLAFAVDLSARRDGAEGTATVDLDHGSFAGLDDVSGHIETRMEGRKVTGMMKTSVGDVGTLEVSRMELDVGGKGPLETDSWRRTWGVLQINGQLDLAKAAALLPPNTLPVSKLAGRLTLQGALKRDDESDITPDVALTLKTSGLRFAPRGGPDQMRNGTIVVATAPWESSGIDIQLDVRADGDSGFAEVAARLVDKEGVIVSLDAKSASVPYERLFASNVAAELLKDVPVSAVIVVPSRKLDHLPDLLKPAGASGEAEARVAIEGTFHKPAIDATAKTHSVKFDRSPLTGGLNADLTAKYDGATADIAIDARASRNGVVHATARVNAKADDLLGKKGAVPWDASAKATLERFPLGSIAGMSDRDVRGQMSGRVEVTDWHKDARAIVDLDLANLRVGAQTFQAGKVKATLDGHSFDASARLERADAVASATANVGTIWGANLAPSVDPAGSSDAAFQARHFPAAILTPFAEGILDELEGTIDADAHVAMRPNEKPTMQGTVALRDGIVELTAVGEELHGVNAKVVFSPDGVVRLESLTAFGTSGKLTASGEARMDGWHLAGADAVLNIPKGDAMPLAVQGASLGSVYGRLDVKAIASPDHKALNVKIDAESLHIDLPEASTHSVEDLDAAEPGTHVGIYASPDRFVLLPLDEFDAQQALEGPPTSSNTLTVDVHLGQNVEIRRGTDLKIDLEGDLTAKIGDPTEVTGQIHLKGGKLDVQGKPFEIERGTVTFLGDSTNPELNVTAGWTAGDGTRVYADYVGPLKTGKVILRSEPARPQNEILALILFGSADGLQPAPSTSGAQTDSATKAGTAVGGFATAGLNKGLNKLTGMEITAKVDTSGPNAKPEVAVQIARDISLQIAVVLGPIAFGTNPDATYATIDWRFFKDWSLETTFGNAGTSIADVVWQHRY